MVLVSSGAVGAGMIKMGITPGPVKPTLAKKQALAAIGQPHLMRYYEDIFNTLGVKCAQVLLTLENLSNRTQYGKAKNTFDELFEMGVVPVVNENDTVAVEELKFGDNDTLSAKVASLVEAKYLFLLTDVDGLYTANPASDPNAKKIDVVEDINALDVDVNSGAGSNVGYRRHGDKAHRGAHRVRRWMSNNHLPRLATRDGDCRRHSWKAGWNQVFSRKA